MWTVWSPWWVAGRRWGITTQRYTGWSSHRSLTVDRKPKPWGMRSADRGWWGWLCKIREDVGWWRSRWCLGKSHGSSHISLYYTFPQHWWWPIHRSPSSCWDPQYFQSAPSQFWPCHKSRSQISFYSFVDRRGRRWHQCCKSSCKWQEAPSEFCPCRIGELLSCGSQQIHHQHCRRRSLSYKSWKHTIDLIWEQRLHQIRNHNLQYDQFYSPSSFLRFYFVFLFFFSFWKLCSEKLTVISRPFTTLMATLASAEDVIIRPYHLISLTSFNFTYRLWLHKRAGAETYHQRARFNLQEVNLGDGRGFSKVVFAISFPLKR